MTRTCTHRLLADARFYERLARRGNARESGIPLRALLASRGLWLLTFHRLSHFCRVHRQLRSPLWWLARILAALGAVFGVLFSRSQIRSDCGVGTDVYLPDKGYLICGASRIGDGTVVHDHCTIGHAVGGGAGGRPHIGRDVWIGPQCIVAGLISIGDGASVMPGSFVTCSVPPRAVAAGNPARIVCRDFDNTALRQGLLIADRNAGVKP